MSWMGKIKRARRPDVGIEASPLHYSKGETGETPVLRLGALDELGAADDEAGLAAERGEQDGDAVAVAHLLQHDGLKTTERAVGNLDEVAGAESRADGYDVDGLAGPLLELADNLVIDDGGATTEADDVDDLGRVSDGAEVVGEI